MSMTSHFTWNSKSELADVEREKNVQYMTIATPQTELHECNVYNVLYWGIETQNNNFLKIVFLYFFVRAQNIYPERNATARELILLSFPQNMGR